MTVATHPGSPTGALPSSQAVNRHLVVHLLHAMTTSDTLLRLQRAEGQDELLASLKDLKNSVIGNVWRKVQVVDDEPTIR